MRNSPCLGRHWTTITHLPWEGGRRGACEALGKLEGRRRGRNTLARLQPRVLTLLILLNLQPSTLVMMMKSTESTMMMMIKVIRVIMMITMIWHGSQVTCEDR